MISLQYDPWKQLNYYVTGPNGSDRHYLGGPSNTPKPVAPKISRNVPTQNPLSGQGTAENVNDLGGYQGLAEQLARYERPNFTAPQWTNQLQQRQFNPLTQSPFMNAFKPQTSNNAGNPLAQYY